MLANVLFLFFAQLFVSLSQMPRVTWNNAEFGGVGSSIPSMGKIESSKVAAVDLLWPAELLFCVAFLSPFLWLAPHRCAACHRNQVLWPARRMPSGIHMQLFL